MVRNNIASERVRLGLSQEELADRLEVGRDAVKDWETGRSSVRASKLLEMGDMFGCSLDYLMGRTDERLMHGALA